MNRVIKFRAWNDIDKTMCDNGVVMHRLSALLSIKNYHVMQFTGLCDVNGVEVYEGDIVYVAGLGNAVVRIAYHCGVYYETADDYQSYSDCAAEGDYPTVVGNIYQNPELLK